VAWLGVRERSAPAGSVGEPGCPEHFFYRHRGIESTGVSFDSELYSRIGSGGNVKALYVLLAAALWSGSSASEAAPQTVKIGSSVVTLDSPPEYVDFCGVDKDAAKLFPSFIPQDNALLSCYTTPTDLKEWKNNEGGVFRSYLIATVMKGTINRTMSLNDLRAFRAQMAASLDTLYTQLEPQIRKQIDKTSATVSKEMGTAVSTKVESVTPVGIFDTNEASFSTVWITTSNHKVSNATISDTQVQVSSIVLVKGKALVLFTYGRFDTPEDVEMYKAVARAWVAKVQSENT